MDYKLKLSAKTVIDSAQNVLNEQNGWKIL